MGAGEKVLEGLLDQWELSSFSDVDLVAERERAIEEMQENRAATRKSATRRLQAIEQEQGRRAAGIKVVAQRINIDGKTHSFGDPEVVAKIEAAMRLVARRPKPESDVLFSDKSLMNAEALATDAPLPSTATDVGAKDEAEGLSVEDDVAMRPDHILTRRGGQLVGMIGTMPTPSDEADVIAELRAIWFEQRRREIRRENAQRSTIEQLTAEASLLRENVEVHRGMLAEAQRGAAEADAARSASEERLGAVLAARTDPPEVQIAKINAATEEFRIRSAHAKDMRDASFREATAGKDAEIEQLKKEKALEGARADANFQRAEGLVKDLADLRTDRREWGKAWLVLLGVIIGGLLGGVFALLK